MSFKRPNIHALAPTNSTPYNEDIAALSTIGMRIRKAVAEGYNTGSDSPHSRRMPLPAHLDQPPSLSGAGSTYYSGSNVSEWGANSNLGAAGIAAQRPIVLLPVQHKRKHEEDPSRFRENIDYTKKYDLLLFNEDF